jgi:uncharacterized protein (TIGR01319 family)
MRRVLGVDIGSTWTKAALFQVEPGPAAVLAQAARPTTQDDLSDAVAAAARGLLGIPPGSALRPALAEVPLYVSSSAKGGLSIAAIGIVPDLTAKVARLAAASAGGRIAAHHSYRLDGNEIAALEKDPPDIVLLCGGTDGGNERFVRANAVALARSCLTSTIVYAGNSSLRDEVCGILHAKRLVVAANAMPEVGSLDIEPAREAIRKVYLDTIVEGRGLSRVQEMAAAPIRPTPLAVYDLLATLAAGARGWDDVLLLDMGGATTDVYSRTQPFHGEEGWVLRGIREPVLARTVEGDLGMRVSARAAWQTAREYLRARAPDRADAVQAWTARVAADTGIVAATESEQALDDLLAEACVHHALLRHAGTVEEAFTPTGRVRVQKGRDLRAVRTIVASGGYLGRRGTAKPVLDALEAARGRVEERTGAGFLLPGRPSVLPDRLYLFPLLGTICPAFPGAAAELAALTTGSPGPAQGHANA